MRQQNTQISMQENISLHRSEVHKRTMKLLTPISDGKSDTCVCGTRWCPQCTVSKQLLTSRFYHSHYAAFVQRCNQQKCKNASCNGRNQKWNYIDEDPGRSDSHNIYCNRISSQAAKNSCAECLCKTSQAELVANGVYKSTAKCSNHTSGKSHHAAKTKQIS